MWGAYSNGCLQFSDLFCCEGSTFSHHVSFQVVRTAALTQWVTSMDISPMGHLIAFATEGSLVLQYILFFCLKGIVVKFSWNPQHKSELKQNSTHLEIKSNKTFDVSQIYFYISLCNIQAIPFSEWKGL